MSVLNTLKKEPKEGNEEDNKIDIKRKKYYTYYITDGNNNEFPALSENKYEQNKTYKLSCNKLMLKGNEYYRIVSAT